MNEKHYTWIPFYTEMANRLLQYRERRQELADIAYNTNAADYIKDVDGSRVNNIDPFTVFGIFNRGLKMENRIAIASNFKEQLAIEAPLPHDFDGIVQYADFTAKETSMEKPMVLSAKQFIKPTRLNFLNSSDMPMLYY